MDIQLATILALVFLIHLIGTPAYTARIAGTRTGRIAISFALFNTLSLISHTSNTFQTPLLSKRIEENLQGGMTSGVEADFRWLLLSASLGTLVGALLIPTFQRLFGKAVNAFSLVPAAVLVVRVAKII
jgi:hypothetical protein